jgi:hypothetical protein
MQKAKTHKPSRTTLRNGRPSLSPYMLDDVAPTLAEIRAARSGPRPDGR